MARTAPSPSSHRQRRLSRVPGAGRDPACGAQPPDRHEGDQRACLGGSLAMYKRSGPFPKERAAPCEGIEPPCIVQGGTSPVTASRPPRQTPCSRRLHRRPCWPQRHPQPCWTRRPTSPSPSPQPGSAPTCWQPNPQPCWTRQPTSSAECADSAAWFGATDLTCAAPTLAAQPCWTRQPTSTSPNSAPTCWQPNHQPCWTRQPTSPSPNSAPTCWQPNRQPWTTQLRWRHPSLRSGSRRGRWSPPGRPRRPSAHRNSRQHGNDWLERSCPPRRRLPADSRTRGTRRWRQWPPDRRPGSTSCDRGMYLRLESIILAPSLPASGRGSACWSV